jgi:bla regulator protein blaR1
MQGALIQTTALALLHFLWEGLLIGIAAAAALRGPAGRTARQRHLICMAALLCCALAPLITAAVVAPRPPALPGLIQVRDAAPQLPGLYAPGPAASGGAPGMMYAAVMAWLAGALCVTGYYIMQWFGVRRVCRSAFELQTPGHLAATARRVLCRWRQTAQVLVMASHAVLSPIVVGIWRPVIIFPAALVARMRAEDFELILLHEAAHIVRRDTWANALQITLEILLFYHPAVHWLSRRARLERECACDDFAVSASGTAYEYARALTALALEPVAPVALGAAGGQLLQRLRHLGGESARAEAFPPAHVLVLAVLLCCLTLMRPPLPPGGIWSLPHPVHARVANGSGGHAAAVQTHDGGTPHATAAPRSPEASAHGAAPRAGTAGERDSRALGREAAAAVLSTPPGQPEAAPHPVHNPVIRTFASQPAAGGGSTAAAAPQDAQAPAAAPAGPPPPPEPPAAPLTPIYAPLPEYPQQARLEGVQGSVLAAVRVGADGRPVGLTILKASPQGVFEGTVRRTLMRWRYAPQNGPDSGRTAVHQLVFSLAGVSSAPAGICATATASRTCGTP